MLLLLGVSECPQSDEQDARHQATGPVEAACPTFEPNAAKVVDHELLYFNDWFAYEPGTSFVVTDAATWDVVQAAGQATSPQADLPEVDFS